jgi:hypothetical protein
MRYGKRIWEIQSWTPRSSTLKKRLSEGWEPFAVAAGRVWIRKQVTK